MMNSQQLVMPVEDNASKSAVFRSNAKSSVIAAKSQKLRLGRISRQSIESVTVPPDIRQLSVINCITKEEVESKIAIDKYSQAFKSKEYFELRSKAARMMSLPNIRLKPSDI